VPAMTSAGVVTVARSAAVTSSDGERRSVKPISAFAGVTISTRLFYRRPQAGAHKGEERVDGCPRPAGRHRMLEERGQLVHQRRSRVAIDAEEGWLADNEAAKQVSVAQCDLDGDRGAAARPDQQAGREAQRIDQRGRVVGVPGVSDRLPSTRASAMPAPVVAHARVAVGEPARLVGPDLGVAAHAVDEQQRRAIPVPLVVDRRVVDVDGRHGCLLVVCLCRVSVARGRRRPSLLL
jgi:hypothetical protein